MSTRPNLRPLPGAMPNSWLTSTRMWMIALGLVALVLVALIGRDTVFAKPAAAAVRTTTATQGSVTSTVTGAGSLTPIGQYNISFRTAGQLTEIDVKVGDHVTTGQVLARIDATTAQNQLAQAQASLAAAQAGLQTAQAPLTAAQLGQLRDALNAAQQNYNDTVNQVNAQNQADATAVQNDRNQVPVNQTQLDADLSKQHMDQISGQARIDSAAQQVTSARDNLNVQSQVKASAVASAQAQLASAQAQVQAAQLAVSETTLTAPASGTVTAINGVVGEFVSAGSGTTAQSPGSTAPLPSTSSSSGSGSGGAGSFMTLVDSSNMEAVIPFAEADAAGIKPNQPATLTFDAISGLTIYGHVLQVSPTPTVVSNVTNYYVSFVLNNSDPRLRPGMTVNAVVTVNESDNVITVPNAAVHTASDGTTTVTVLDANGQQEQREVEVGLVGDSTTEIRRGLNAGEKVVLPTVRLSTTTGAGGGGRGFFFGGGGGGAIRGGG